MYECVGMCVCMCVCVILSVCIFVQLPSDHKHTSEQQNLSTLTALLCFMAFLFFI